MGGVFKGWRVRAGLCATGLALAMAAPGALAQQEEKVLNVYNGSDYIGPDVIALFSSSGCINDMVNGSICVALGWSGDISIARQRALDTKSGQKVEVLIPKNSGLLFFDTMAIASDAPQPITNDTRRLQTRVNTAYKTGR